MLWTSLSTAAQVPIARSSALRTSIGPMSSVRSSIAPASTGPPARVSEGVAGPKSTVSVPAMRTVASHVNAGPMDRHSSMQFGVSAQRLRMSSTAFA